MPTAVEVGVNFNYTRKLKDQIRARAQAVVGKAVFDIEAGAKTRAPVDTGTLRGSIRGRIDDGGMSGEVAVNAEYGAFVEFGTVRMAAQPYFIPAIEAVRGSYMAAMKQIAQL